MGVGVREGTVQTIHSDEVLLQTAPKDSRVCGSPRSHQCPESRGSAWSVRASTLVVTAGLGKGGCEQSLAVADRTESQLKPPARS